MRLTDSTEIKLLANGFLAIFEGTGVATLARPTADTVYPCGWLVDLGYTEDGDRMIEECGALSVEFDNGFACLNGHDHRNDAEYFTADEMEHNLRNGHGLPANARLV